MGKSKFYRSRDDGLDTATSDEVYEDASSTATTVTARDTPETITPPSNDNQDIIDTIMRDKKAYK